MEQKYQIIVKATNTNTKQVIYEGVKKEFKTYLEAARRLSCCKNGGFSWHGNPPSSYRINGYYSENCISYVSWRHWGSIRTTLYIKQKEDRK